MAADPEVKSWQAQAYQQLGRELATKRLFYEARIYLQKALKLDPHNPKLWAEVEYDFFYIEKYSGL